MARSTSGIRISTGRALLPLSVTLVVALAAAVPAAAQQVTLERDSPLYAEPRLDSSQMTQLKLGATGEVIGKQGAWLNLKTPAGSGWLFSFNVRFPSQQAGTGDSGAGSAAGRLFGPRRSVSVTSTIGIRGIEEEDLRQASFSADQIKLLDRYVVTKEAAERGARASGLAPASIDYMDAKK
ncbi:MAG: SH3 domain-containing protein [Burkholderiales bacterium]